MASPHLMTGHLATGSYDISQATYESVPVFQKTQTHTHGVI